MCFPACAGQNLQTALSIDPWSGVTGEAPGLLTYCWHCAKHSSCEFGMFSSALNPSNLFVWDLYPVESKSGDPLTCLPETHPSAQVRRVGGKVVMTVVDTLSVVVGTSMIAEVVLVVEAVVEASVVVPSESHGGPSASGNEGQEDAIGLHLPGAAKPAHGPSTPLRRSDTNLTYDLPSSGQSKYRERPLIHPASQTCKPS